MHRRTVAFVIALVGLAGVLLWIWTQPEPGATAAVPDAAVAPRPPAPIPAAEPRLTAPTSPADNTADSDRSATPTSTAAISPRPIARAMGSVTVRVVNDDETPQPLKDVDVTLVPLGRGALCFRSTARSDEQGRARFENVEVGPVIALGDRSGRTEGEVRAKQVTELMLEVPRGCSAEGRVVGRDGHMLSQPEVWLYNAGRYEKIASCDSIGRYRIDNLESGSFLTGVTREASSSQPVQINGAPGETIHADIVVDKPGTVLLGQVLDTAEQPVAGAVVGVSDPGRGGGMLGDGGYMMTTTDGEGRFMLWGLSGSQLLMVRTQLFAPYMAQVECKFGERIEHIVRLQPSATLIGKTTFADGTPAAGSIIVVGDMFDDMLGTVGISDENGEYRVTGLAPGLQTLRARCRAGDDAEQDLELFAGRAVVWNVVVPRSDDEPTTSR